MIIPLLILAHLIGDFVLQPSKLVKWKMHNALGTVVHASVHLVVSLVLLLPLILNGHTELIPTVVAVCFVHFLIDESKISYDLKHDSKVRPFVIDQIFHILTILVAAYVLRGIDFTLPEGPFYDLYSNLYLIIFLSTIIYITKVVDIYNYQKQREKNQKARLKFDTKKGHRRALIFTITYILILLVLFLTGATDFYA